ncbi:capsule assembly Wzi family protein [Pseudemcibacter aquimaris]|uniref:capsule assembly Wzi family protein n=1 Tax=Pseudemcibacter aquimaris TaxID=2857064 RepID=UPI002011C899|nr:capsule assembly Wzi family protein [Pseudemcibacter aquimaris]MCC3861733.1 capsule assembly Wzi family protein [Pseudemcibacter aquimaris]WDU58502.1 capsule assembly Wzi family protein [Pseudemcibacter aquimaris]
MNKLKSILVSASIGASLLLTSAYASPWASPGDSQLRSDVELLAHHGLISGPVNSWPMSWKQITSGFYKADSMTLPAYVQRALDRVRDKIPNKVNAKAKASYANQVQFFRGFEDEPRSKAEFEGAVELNLDNTSIHIEGRVFDTEDFNLDNSYISQEFGNWSAYVGAVDRWWGPGQETTTLLSTNAKPMPSIGIRRVTSQPFQTKWINWMGPWDAEVFISKMDENRHIPEPIFVGMRLNFEPIDNFEVGLARSLMLCGQDRPCGFKQWANGLIAVGDLDNTGEISEQPGNQLAQIALSYSFNLTDKIDTKIYAEGTAEDIHIFLPFKYSRLVGMNFNGSWGVEGDRWNVTLEASDTMGSQRWFYGHRFKGTMYNHHLYKTGYRYYNQVIGHSLDSNSQYFSVKSSIVRRNGIEFGIKYQNILVNSEDNHRNILSTNREKINSFNVMLIAPTKLGKFLVQGRYMDNGVNTPVNNDDNFTINFAWQMEL